MNVTDNKAVNLSAVLKSHAAYLRGEGGERANLIGANLHGVNLSGVNLSGANLHGVILTGVNLTDAILRWANLTDALVHPVPPPQQGGDV